MKNQTPADAFAENRLIWSKDEDSAQKINHPKNNAFFNVLLLTR